MKKSNYFYQLGSFRSNGIDYFIEPDEEFDHLDLNTNHLLNKSNINNTELSYIYINHQIITLQTHIIYKKAFDTTELNSKESCALLGM